MTGVQTCALPILAEARLGERVRWRPMLLGAVFKQVGTADVPMFEQSAAKRKLTAADLHRQAADAVRPSRFRAASR